MRRYHCGCGGDIRKGYTNIDGFNPKADIVADMRYLKYEPCSEILCRHAFEHLTYVDSFLVLSRWTEALEVGGKLILEVPDTFRIAREASHLGAQAQARATRLIHGSQEADWALHMCSWAEEWSKFVLETFGYRGVSFQRTEHEVQCWPNYALIISAIKDTALSNEELLYKSKMLLGWYLHPSETEMHQKYIRDLEAKWRL
jgi:hypothetical protein